MGENRGQVLVEAAVIIPLLLLLIFGIVDFARLMYVKNTLTNAARAGARAASVDRVINEESNVVISSSSTATGTAINKCLYYTDQNGTHPYNGIPADAVMTYDVSRLPTSGPIAKDDVVQVTVACSNFTMITPFYRIAALVANSSAPSSSNLTLTARAAMRYEGP